MVYANEVGLLGKVNTKKERYRPCTDIGFVLPHILITSLNYKTNHEMKIHNTFFKNAVKI
jgi:hypothetical protein